MRDAERKRAARQPKILPKSAGIGKMGSRTIRHTMATELRRAGVPLWDVEGMMGHKMPSTSERYAHYAPGYLSSAVNAIDDYFDTHCADVVRQRWVKVADSNG